MIKINLYPTNEMRVTRGAGAQKDKWIGRGLLCMSFIAYIFGVALLVGAYYHG